MNGVASDIENGTCKTLANVRANRVLPKGKVHKLIILYGTAFNTHILPEPVGPTSSTLLLSNVGASSTAAIDILLSAEVLSAPDAFCDGGLIHPLRCHEEFDIYCGTTETKKMLKPIVIKSLYHYYHY